MADDRKCRSEDCEAHLFMVETMKELKVMNTKLMESQQRLSEASVKLTENILEIHRTNDKLDDVVRELRTKDDEQDKAIEAQRAFTNRALGALALITFLSPFILYLLTQN